jgi:hypothetical protein
MLDFISMKIIYSFLMFFIINRISSNSNINYTFRISMDYSSELDYLYINSGVNTSVCEKWIPSLFSPILLANENIEEQSLSMMVNIPTISFDPFGLELLKDFQFINKYEVLIALDRYKESLHNCYLGLSSKLEGFDIDDTEIMINQLNNAGIINAKIFSIDKWNIDIINKKIDTSIYYGFEHNDFILENENATVGNCSLGQDYKYWGCSFDQMSLDNNIVNLTDENKEPYKIYFSTENYNIIFPQSFNSSFLNLTNKLCQNYSNKIEDPNYYVTCKDLLGHENYIPIKLISKTMNITIEIDSQTRFNNKVIGTKKAPANNRTNIRFEKIDYFILPLIMFKNFHIQFDARNDLIKFYTEEKDILEVPKDKKDNNNNNGNNSSKAFIVFLIILIIILSIALLYAAFWFIRKKRGSVEKNINKYNKFDEDENFQNMSEKRVF